MKFKLNSVRHNIGMGVPPAILFKQYPVLFDYNPKVIEEEYIYDGLHSHNMHIEVETLEDLEELGKAIDEPLIITTKGMHAHSEENEIQIYDGWL